jgi:ABC-type transport system involved in cytochrome bd biosynthesis fused ATPase/permease subunit
MDFEDNIETSDISNLKYEDCSLAIILDNINIKIPKGKLIGLIGKIGSGKSTLINGLIGEVITLEEDNVEINISGSMSYVSQKSWIQNETIRNNILFGKPYQEEKYKKVIHYSAMESDLEIMADGDLTQIGEKGANLSGGQKLRVQLARALYSDDDIILLDDPLSPLDAHVGKFIFK